MRNKWKFLVLFLSFLFFFSFNQSKAHASDWQVVGSGQWFGWDYSPGSGSTTAPGRDLIRNTVRIGNGDATWVEAPYYPGYEYKIEFMGFDGISTLYGVENYIYGAKTSHNYGYDVNTIYLNPVYELRTITISMRPYGADHALYDVYNVSSYQGTALGWAYMGSWSDREVWGYTEIITDTANKTNRPGGQYVRLSQSHPLVYTFGSPEYYNDVYSSSVEKYTYTSVYGGWGGQSGPSEWVIGISYAYWTTGYIYYNSEYLGRQVLQRAQYPQQSALGLPYGSGSSYGGYRQFNMVSPSYDTSPPSVSMVPDTTGWVTSMGMSITASDPSGVSSLYVQYPGQGWTSIYNGQRISISQNGTYNVQATDGMGNTGYTSYYVGNIDTAGPTLNLSRSSNSWSRNLTLYWDSSDSQSGFNRIVLPDGSTSYSSSGGIVVYSNGTYSFISYDNVGYSTTKTLTVNNIDTISPTVTITPSYTDLVNTDIHLIVNASDNVGISDITDPDGRVYSSTNLAYLVRQNGTYTFAVRDLAGNITYKGYTVTNIDKTPPVIQSLKLYSNNANKGYAKRGDSFFALIGFSEPIKSSPVNVIFRQDLPTAALSLYDSSRNLYVATGTFPASSSDFLLNTITAITNVSDIAGNVANFNNISSTDGTSIQFYSKAPKALITAITSSKGNPGYAIEGSVVNITWESNQHLGVVPSVDILGRLSTTTLISETPGGKSVYSSSVAVRKEDAQGKVTWKFRELINKAGSE